MFNEYEITGRSRSHVVQSCQVQDLQLTSWPQKHFLPCGMPLLRMVLTSYLLARSVTTILNYAYGIISMMEENRFTILRACPGISRL